jgi:arginine transport system substrate-binding protein
MKFLKKLSLCCLFLSAISSPVLAENAKPLVLATEATYPPFESVNNQGQMIGFDVEVLSAICANLKKECKFVNQPWDSLIPGLQLGKFDVIFGAMNITAERQKQIDFTAPYYFNTGSFVAPKSAKLSLDPQSLKNKTIGVQGSTTYDYYMQAKYEKIVHLNRYSSIQDAFLDLQSGRIDAVFGDSPIILEWLKNPANNSAYNTVGEPVNDPKFFSSGYGFGVKKSNTELLNQLNQGLNAIKANGEYQKIVQKYFGKNA